MLKSLNFISVRWCLYQVPIFRNKKKKRTIQPHNKINFLWELHFINNGIWSSTIHFSKSKAIPDVKHVTVFTLICKNKKITRKIQSHLHSFNIAITIYFYPFFLILILHFPIFVLSWHIYNYIGKIPYQFSQKFLFDHNKKTRKFSKL